MEPTMQRHALVLGPVLAFSAAFVPTLTGCDLTRFTANSSAGLFTRAGGAVERHWDTDLVGAGLPASIMQLEGIYSVVPDNEPLGLQLARAYSSYAFGWVEERIEIADAEGELEEADALASRARLLYERARNIGLHHLRARNAGIDDALSGPPADLAGFLARTYTDREAAPALFWTGYAWASSINVGIRTDSTMVLQLSKAQAFVDRAVALDESYFHYAGLVFQGVLASTFAEDMGGHPEQGRELFERALRGTGRHFYTVHVNYARTYAVNTGNRALFISLLREVIDGGDPDESVRIANRLARRRAIRLLGRIDELFSH
jgi:hypothetical protein